MSFPRGALQESCLLAICGKIQNRDGSRKSSARHRAVAGLRRVRFRQMKHTSILNALSRLRSILKYVMCGLLVVCAYYNVIVYCLDTQNLPFREADELVRKERDLAPVRQILSRFGHKGEVAFVTYSSVMGKPPSPEDDKRWGQAQYALIPWVLVREKQNTRFVLADFWQGTPAGLRPDLRRIFDAGDGIVLLGP